MEFPIALGQVNYWAVLVSGIAAMVLGAFWYGPLFGKLWMKLSGLTEKDIKAAQKKGMAKSYFFNFLAVLVTACTLAHFFYYLKVETMLGGIQIALYAWLGFIAAISLGTVLWEGKPFRLYVLNNAYNIVSLVAMTAILISWK